MYARADGLLGLAGAGNAQGPLGPSLEQELGNRPGLNTGPATVQDLVTVRVAEKSQLLVAQ